MLIKLDCKCYVDADSVAEVTVNDLSDTISVRCKDGIGHVVDRDYGKGVYETLDRLVREINAARSTLIL